MKTLTFLLYCSVALVASGCEDPCRSETEWSEDYVFADDLRDWIDEDGDLSSDDCSMYCPRGEKIVACHVEEVVRGDRDDVVRTSKEDDGILITGELLTCSAGEAGGIGGGAAEDCEPGVIITNCQKVVPKECE